MLLWVNISQCLLLFAHVCTKVKAQAVCMVRLNRRLHKNLIKPRNTVDISSKRIRSLDKANHRTPKPPKGLGAIELVVCCRQQSTGMWNLTGAIANCWYLDVESADVGPLWCPLGRAWTWLQGVAVLSMDGFALILTVKLRRLFERPYTVTGAVANCENSWTCMLLRIDAGVSDFPRLEPSGCVKKCVLESVRLRR